MCNETVDNVVGILNAKDYFRLGTKDRETVMKKAVHPAYFVPESVKLDVLFQNMKKSKNSFAIVLDEYGGTTGIITINDLVEQLVGDFDYDDSNEPRPIESIESLIQKHGKSQAIQRLTILKKHLIYHLKLRNVTHSAA